MLSLLQFTTILVLLIGSNVITAHNEPKPFILATKLGKVKGLEEQYVPSGRKYFAFRGIPYAQPPVKEHRFENPVPVTGWDGVQEATTDGPPCPQFHIATNRVIGKEDCLVLNVYTPSVEDLKPVIVFIHGGGFVTGTASSELYGPDLMDEQGLVLVTIQYRLGAFGFLSWGEGSGNWGLLDQLEALRWVKANIAAFGGDPDKVSLLGEGAGAASATLLTLTPSSIGLFQNVIALAGTPLNTQYFQKDPLESARELASRLKCSYDDFNQLLKCVRKARMESIVKSVNAMFSFFSFPRWFAPSIDGILFKSTPQNVLIDGDLLKVPILTGFGRHEGAFYYPLTLNSFSDGKYDGNFIEERIPRVLPVISEFESKLFPLSRAIGKRYFTNIDYDNEEEFRPRYVDFLTDLLFVRSMTQYGNLLSNRSIPLFAFVLDYYGSNSIMDVIGDTDMKNIAHGDILQYLFSQVLGEGKELPADDKDFATKTLLPLITNFVKTGNPTPKPFSGLIWPKFTSKDQTVLSLGKKLSLLPQFRSNILKFWQETVPQLLSKRPSESEHDEL